MRRHGRAAGARAPAHSCARTAAVAGRARGALRPGPPITVQAMQSRSEPELAELLRVALPLLRHPHVQIEVHPNAEQGLDLDPGPTTDVTQPARPGTDHDRLLALPFHVDVG